MTVSPETLLAFVEGELSSEEARRVAAEVANDPSLAAHVENHKALKARLQAASLPTPLPDGVPNIPVDKSHPDGCAVLQPRSDSDVKAARRGAASNWITAGAMAAGIALGVLLAFTLRPGSEIRSADGSAVAEGALERALSTVIGVEQSDAAPARIGESFFSSDGYFCRNFTTTGDAKGALAGIACREGEEWRIRVLAAAEPADPDKKEAKAAPLPAAVRDTLDRMMIGQPLDAEGERAARAQSWLVR
jgi:hypothetical protein